ncbi:MAG: alpha-ketoacid dehydrogenase subunit beta [Ardenticatenaceae bacterium]|nr:alpha-ketoacid dehydrogenase subunit beta [Ardenticatenaceae bacterium]
MREVTFAGAIREALAEEMRRDSSIFIMGEDVARAGGIFKITAGLLDEFGPNRVIDTPISEEGIVGLGVGAAMTGLHPVVEMMFGDFVCLAMDQVVNQAAKMCYMTGGQASVPLVLRCTMGAGRASAAQHSQSLQAWFAHIPGLKVAIPATPRDAKGLLKTALRDPNPVLFFEDKMMYKLSGPLFDEEEAIPFGRAEVKRAGRHLTLVATSSMVHVALEAAEALAGEGIEAEVVDPRTLVPLDEETILESVRKTGRVVLIDEGYQNFGVTAEIAARIADKAFDWLDAPVKRLGAADVPVPFSPALEPLTIPTATRVAELARPLFGRRW